VGETGLDYHYDLSPRDIQRQRFGELIDLAAEVGKPVVCHIRDGDGDGDPRAHDDARRILTEHGILDRVGGIVHCFTGTPEDAAAYVALGMYVSFSGIVTFKGASAEPIRQAVRAVPPDRLLIETDCPYLAPVPMRGKRNEPAFLVHTAAVVAREAGMSVEELARRTVANTRSLLSLT
jgi:TatD DNase family protein